MVVLVKEKESTDLFYILWSWGSPTAIVIQMKARKSNTCAQKFRPVFVVLIRTLDVLLSALH